MLHGWLPRGDLADPAVRRDAAAAMGRLKGFLNKHLRAAPKCDCPCVVCTCENCECKPGGAGCEPCGTFQKSAKVVNENKL
jgi:hypothetical protein